MKQTKTQLRNKADKLTFMILGIPKPKQSVRIGKTRYGKTIAFKHNDIATEERNIKWDIKSQLPVGFQPWQGGIIINKLHYVFPPPKSIKKSLLQIIEEGGIVPKTTRPDLTDNLQKGLIDSMTGIVFLDDSQICEMNDVKKYYGLKPRIEIEMVEI